MPVQSKTFHHQNFVNPHNLVNPNSLVNPNNVANSHNVANPHNIVNPNNPQNVVYQQVNLNLSSCQFGNRKQAEDLSFLIQNLNNPSNKISKFEDFQHPINHSDPSKKISKFEEFQNSINPFDSMKKISDFEEFPELVDLTDIDEFVSKELSKDLGKSYFSL
jgi:hypothetical protein